MSKSGYYTGDFIITALSEQTDKQLFRALRYNPIHPLHCLLPSERSTPYVMRSRVHYYELPSKNRYIDECTFIYRVLYKDCFSVLIWFNSGMPVIFSIKTTD